MMRMRKDGGGVGAGSEASADATKVVIAHPNLDEVVSATIMVLLDEINDLRADPLTVKAAKTPEQIRDAIEIKLGN